jgi:periplasmic protein TonB
VSVRPPPSRPALRDWVAGVVVSSALYGSLLAAWSWPSAPPRAAGGPTASPLWVQLGATPGDAGVPAEPARSAGLANPLAPAPARIAAGASSAISRAPASAPPVARPHPQPAPAPVSSPPPPTPPRLASARAAGTVPAAVAAEPTARRVGAGGDERAGPPAAGAADEPGVTAAAGGDGEAVGAGAAGTGGDADPALEAYFARLFRAARRSLERRYPSTADEGVVLLRVQIDRGGRIARCEVVESSGSPALDRAAVRDFRRAGPFGPVPSGASSRDLLFDYPVEYALVRGGAGRSR